MNNYCLSFKANVVIYVRFTSISACSLSLPSGNSKLRPSPKKEEKSVCKAAVCPTIQTTLLDSKHSLYKKFNIIISQASVTVTTKYVRKQLYEVTVLENGTFEISKSTSLTLALQNYGSFPSREFSSVASARAASGNNPLLS